MIAYPLFFEPILKEKVWGGRTLAELGKDLPADVPIGESWELADLPDAVRGGRSIIVNGALAGRTLREAIAECPEEIMGPLALTAEGGFPLLVKFLDARDNLSVQVHPDAAYTRRHPEAFLKSEAWIVVRAEPGAVIYKGVKPDVTPQEFTHHVADGSVVEDLIAVPVSAGECHYLPSGTCHALGAGLVVAEIQTPSDTTFRVFDWGREDRELHLAQALECINFGDPPRPAEKPGVTVEIDSLATTPLVRAAEFAAERLEARADAVHAIETSGQPEVWMVLAGGGRIESPDAEPVGIAAGAVTLLPAALQGAEATLREGTEILRITLPTPIDGLIA